MRGHYLAGLPWRKLLLKKAVPCPGRARFWSTTLSAQDDLDGEVDLARHRDGDDRRSSAIAAVGVLTAVSRTKPVIGASDWRFLARLSEGVRPGWTGLSIRGLSRDQLERLYQPKKT